MEDGRAIDQGGKYRKAQQCNTKVLTEAELEELIQKLSGKPFHFGEKRARITENVKASAAAFELMEVALLGGNPKLANLEPVITFKGLLNLDTQA